MSITEQLARFAVESRADILTDDVAASAKLKFLDTIAVMIRGAHHPSGTSALRVAQRMGGKPAATLFANGEKHHLRSRASSTVSPRTRWNTTTTRAASATSAYAWSPAASRSPRRPARRDTQRSKLSRSALKSRRALQRDCALL